MGAIYHRNVKYTGVNMPDDYSIIGPEEKTATASRAYAVGEHFVKDGYFCTAIAAIAQGATLTLNTNYTQGDIAAAIGPTGTITKVPTSGTLDSTTCVKHDGIVTVSGRIHTMSNVIANGNYFIVPEGFRPKENIYCIGAMNITGVGLIPVLLYINTTGYVGGYYDNSHNVAQIAFSATYCIKD